MSRRGDDNPSLVQASRSVHTSQQSLAPVPALPEKGGKVRYGLIPEEIFQFLYPKTGVTGPYVLGTGLLTYLLSKEIYVINHETFAAASIGIVIIYGIKKFGPSVAAFADKLNDEKVSKVREVKELAVSNLQQAVEDEKKEQWRAEGRQNLFDAKRNNVAMLLEINYRERLHMVTNEVKKRLDYQIALQNLQRRMEQEHLVSWVEKSVVKSITPQQEKESIAKCITDLKIGYSPDGPVAQRSGSISRPSAKTIYQQRKEYAESMLKQPDNFQYRVEHLFTCGLDQKEVRSVDDCIARLKLLDAKGRVWGQDMILQVKDGSLQLTDIETKSYPTPNARPHIPYRVYSAFWLVQECTAVLQSCVYNSILTVTVRERSRRGRSVFLFQCEEVGAEHIQSDMEKLLQEKRDGRRDQDNIRNDLESMLAQPAPGRFQGKPLPPESMLAQPAPGRFQGKPLPPLQPENRWSGPDQSIPSWDGPDYDEFPNFDQPPPREEERKREEPEIDMIKSQRNMEILNHVLSDLELFTQQLNECVAAQSTDKKSKKKSKKEKGEQNIGKLDGRIQNPSASDLVHVLFPALSFIMSHCPEPDLPASILSPLLIQPALELLENNVTPDEQRLWKSLGEAWNLPRSLWPDADSIPPYIPEFSDGWEPPVPEPTRNLERDHRDRQSQRSSRTVPEQQPNSDPRSFPPIRANEQPHFMRVMYDFMARNSQELSIMKGEILLVLDKSRKWFRARNIREEEGFVPNNVLEPLEEEEEEHNVYQDLPPTLNRKSRPEDVKAWLQYKGFSKITVRCLGVLSGSLLLGMTRDEIKTVCPEEGGRVFFQLQAVKSSLADRRFSSAGRHIHNDTPVKRSQFPVCSEEAVLAHSLHWA
ncbi:UNVERIFIED_CONTAM: hypothetical protein FKN15_031193 [Acipenser sinensis]